MGHLLNLCYNGQSSHIAGYICTKFWEFSTFICNLQNLKRIYIINTSAQKRLHKVENMICLLVWKSIHFYYVFLLTWSKILRNKCHQTLPWWLICLHWRQPPPPPPPLLADNTQRPNSYSHIGGIQSTTTYNYWRCFIVFYHCCFTAFSALFYSIPPHVRDYEFCLSTAPNFVCKE